MKFGFCSLSCCKGSEHKKRCFVSSLRHVFVPAPSGTKHKETGQLKRRVVASVHFQQKMGREKTKEKATSCRGLDPGVLSGPKVLQTQRSCHESSEPWRTNKQTTRQTFQGSRAENVCAGALCLSGSHMQGI